MNVDFAYHEQVTPAVTELTERLTLVTCRMSKGCGSETS